MFQCLLWIVCYVVSCKRLFEPAREELLGKSADFLWFQASSSLHLQFRCITTAVIRASVPSQMFMDFCVKRLFHFTRILLHLSQLCWSVNCTRGVLNRMLKVKHCESAHGFCLLNLNSRKFCLWMQSTTREVSVGQDYY